jgi:hypothetical protein
MGAGTKMSVMREMFVIALSLASGCTTENVHQTIVVMSDAAADATNDSGQTIVQPDASEAPDDMKSNAVDVQVPQDAERAAEAAVDAGSETAASTLGLGAACDYALGTHDAGCGVASGAPGGSHQLGCIGGAYQMCGFICSTSTDVSDCTAVGGSCNLNSVSPGWMPYCF